MPAAASALRPQLSGRALGVGIANLINVTDPGRPCGSE
jgi:hypothetical protein